MNEEDIYGLQSKQNYDYQNQFKKFENDKCRAHLAECYNLTKKNELLEKEISIKTQENINLQNQIEELLETQKCLEQISNSNMEKMNNIVEKLNKENSILSQTHPYKEVLEYYEKQIEDVNIEASKQLKEYLGILQSLGKGENNFQNREDIYKKVIKRLEKENSSLKDELNNFQKQSRQLNSKQEFFNKYITEAERRLTELNKKVKMNKQLEKDKSLLKEQNEIYELELFKKDEKIAFLEKITDEIKEMINENKNSLNREFFVSQISKINSFHQTKMNTNTSKSKFEFTIENKENEPDKTKKFNNKEQIFAKQQQDSKLLGSKSTKALYNPKSTASSFSSKQFSNIKDKNLDQYKELQSIEDQFNNINLENETKIYENTNIMKLINNMKELIKKLVVETEFSNLDEEVIESMFSNIRSYFIFMIKSYKKMSVNQYELINLTCEFKEKLCIAIKQSVINSEGVGDQRKLLISKDLINAYYNDLSNICNLMLFEKNPKKLDFLIKV